MINFILYNNAFDIILLTLAYANIILNNNVADVNRKPKKKNQDNISKFKRKVSIFYSIIILIVVALVFFYKHIIYTIIIGIAALKSIYDIYINIIRNSTSLTINDKKMYAFSTFVIYVFFSSSATNIYISNFSFLGHTTKEILLLLYLNAKIMIYVFLILINFSIFISNIKALFIKILKRFIPRMKTLVNKKITLKLYDFYLYRRYKNGIALLIDKFIYIITLPFYFIIIVVVYLFVNIFRLIVLTTLRILQAFSNFDNNRDKIIKQILRISLISSLIAIFIIAVHSKNIFSAEIIEVYNLIITVILIPIVYDEIKQGGEKIKGGYNEKNTNNYK